VKLSCTYVIIASLAISFGTWRIRSELQAMDERDQDWAVAHYANFKGRSVIDKSQELKDKTAALVAEIKARWGMTPEELVRHFYRRRGILMKRLPAIFERGPTE
jgi:hypothetical protein